MAAPSRSMTSAFRSAATSCSRCSVRTAPARRRCSTSSAPSSSPTAAPRGSAASTSSPSRCRRGRSLGVVFQEPSLDDRLTVYENLNFHGLVYGVPAARRKSRIDEMLHVVELSEWRDALVRTLSAGMKRRLEIARALVHDARVLFLDEPTVGLDAQSRGRLWQHVQALRAKRDLTVIVTTHYIEEMESCDRVCIIDHGRILTNDAPMALKVAHGQQLIRVVASDEATAAEIVAAYPDLAHRKDAEIVIKSSGEAFAEALLTRVRRTHPPVHRRGADARKRVPVAHRARAARRAGERARAHFPVRHDEAANTQGEWRARQMSIATQRRRRAVDAAQRPLCDLAARGQTRDPRPRPVRRRRKPADPVGADHGDRPQSVFPRRDLRRGAVRRSLHLPAVHLPRGDRAQHHVHLGAVGGVDHLGPRVRLPARDPGVAAAAVHHPARQDSRRHHGGVVPRLPRARARPLRRCSAQPVRPRPRAAR